MRKVGLYLRVSTQEQAERGWGIEGQYTELRKYCEGREDCGSWNHNPKGERPSLASWPYCPALVRQLASRLSVNSSEQPTFKSHWKHKHHIRLPDPTAFICPGIETSPRGRNHPARVS